MKDELFFNKFAAAGLTVALMFFGLPILVNVFYGGGHHGSAAHDEEIDESNPLGLAYPIEFTLEGGPAVEEAEVDLGTLLANANPAAGERAIAICLACHTFEQGGANGTGPNLWGIVGADIAAHAGFSYSGALSALEGTWTYEKLDAYLENSQGYVPGTQMVQRIGKEDRRADILAYLATLTSGEPVPFPEPAPAEAPAEDMAEAEGADITVDDTASEETMTESGAEALEEAGQLADEAEDEAAQPETPATESDGETNQGEIQED
ncbi:c-type cytochrome [Aquisalinus flavus]|uniref:Cytochrome c domain-containing protein n=1 Tax=Aquisalinus flavus TaxID=1526572 RepID=A0A8J2V5Y8_9PROT|nr:c-type cytochrome [Aquisalinus flavus]MBD0425934.1 c-type cytochrome [Aquisalinus flavus]UNE48472.1 c-type cytochrome [Aquisalinus flavus]GGD12079.1 hypothetical protein GCM10011342_21100 [Aquisalinus flavus]